MTEHSSRTAVFRVRREFLVGLVLSLIALFIFAFASGARTGGFRSVELKFTDNSAGGLSIVPASCPSDPQFPGDCSTTPTAPDNNCSITALNDLISPGDNTTLSWATANFQSPIFGSVNPSSSTLTPGFGAVDPNGSSIITPTITTTYSLSGSYKVFGIPVATYTCAHTVYVYQCPTGYSLQGAQCVLTSCPAGHILSAGACVFTGGSCASSYICQGNWSALQGTDCGLSQWTQCPYGCYSGGCVVPSPSIASWSVHPILVRQGTSVQVSWQTQNVQGCTVSGTNGDSWTTNSGTQTSSPIEEQTIYTITCQGYPGSSPASVSQYTTVNIVPQFQEQ